LVWNRMSRASRSASTPARPAPNTRSSRWA
jgi:hypothetical protein